MGGAEIEVGSMVEIWIQGKPYYGVIKWKGVIERISNEILVGLEIENPDLQIKNACTDGKLQGKRYFSSPSGRAFFTKLHQCLPDQRFTSSSPVTMKSIEGSMESIDGSILPAAKLNENFLGRNKGIQGHHNSCYMDATLFAMFSYSQAFDVVLNRRKRKDDNDHYNEVQKILKKQIVNPLRTKGFVDHRSVLELREYLDKLGNIRGFLNEEKDPEEFVVLLFEKVLKVDPFVKLEFVDQQREEVLHLYQIFAEKDERNTIPTIQYLLEYSFLTSDLKLAEVPSVMILQMPRFGQQKLYKTIKINAELDITPLLVDVKHRCFLCGDPAKGYCKDCTCDFGWDTVYAYLCGDCCMNVHKHPKRKSHKSYKLESEKTNNLVSESDHVIMELFSVVCIEKSHYVSFVKCGVLNDNESWVFFDSMADRHGGEDGYNIPEVTKVDNLDKLLKGDLSAIVELDKKEDEKVLRLFEDASLCFYMNKSRMMYR